jgi:hypothetical protein
MSFIFLQKLAILLLQNIGSTHIFVYRVIADHRLRPSHIITCLDNCGIIYFKLLPFHVINLVLDAGSNHIIFCLNFRHELDLFTGAIQRLVNPVFSNHNVSREFLRKILLS